MNSVTEMEKNELLEAFQCISAQRIETAEWNAVYPAEIKEEVRTYGKSPFPILIYGEDNMEPDNLGIWCNCRILKFLLLSALHKTKEQEIKRWLS